MSKLCGERIEPGEEQVLVFFFFGGGDQCMKLSRFGAGIRGYDCGLSVVKHQGRESWSLTENHQFGSGVGERESGTILSRRFVRFSATYMRVMYSLLSVIAPS